MTLQSTKTSFTISQKRASILSITPSKFPLIAITPSKVSNYYNNTVCSLQHHLATSLWKLGTLYKDMSKTLVVFPFYNNTYDLTIQQNQFYYFTQTWLNLSITSSKFSLITITPFKVSHYYNNTISSPQRRFSRTTWYTVSQVPSKMMSFWSMPWLCNQWFHHKKLFLQLQCIVHCIKVVHWQWS